MYFTIRCPLFAILEKVAMAIDVNVNRGNFELWYGHACTNPLKHSVDTCIHTHRPPFQKLSMILK